MSDFFGDEGDFPKAAPIERGCGKRKTGGVYVECGLVPAGYGRPFSEFLLDPPQPPPEGVDIVNKVQTWQDSAGVQHLLIWVGAEHYPYLPDFIEEARRYGISRRVRGNFDFSVLTPGSRMVLIHPAAINPSWQFQSPPSLCPKNITAHVEPLVFPPPEAAEDESTPDNGEGGEGSQNEELAAGECLGQLWDLLPQSVADQILSRAEVAAVVKDDQTRLAVRKLPSLEYLFTPASPTEVALLAEFPLQPGIFGIFPITGFALIERDDGTVNEAARTKLGEAGLSFYQAQA